MNLAARLCHTLLTRPGAAIVAIIVVVIGVLAVLTRGGVPPMGVDMSDPRAVARAYAAAEYRCGAEGAGVRYDLSITTSPAGRLTRDDVIQYERTHGCRPKPMPQLLVACGPVAGDMTVVEVAAGATSAVMTLVRVDGAWKVDTYRSDTNALAS
jgi:hypothetical protein